MEQLFPFPHWVAEIGNLWDNLGSRRRVTTFKYKRGSIFGNVKGFRYVSFFHKKTSIFSSEIMARVSGTVSDYPLLFLWGNNGCWRTKKTKKSADHTSIDIIDTATHFFRSHLKTWSPLTISRIILCRSISFFSLDLSLRRPLFPPQYIRENNCFFVREFFFEGQQLPLFLNMCIVGKEEKIPHPIIHFHRETKGWLVVGVRRSQRQIHIPGGKRK